MQATAQLYKHRTNDQFKQVKEEVEEMASNNESENVISARNEELLGLEE